MLLAEILLLKGFSCVSSYSFGFDYSFMLCKIINRMYFHCSLKKENNFSESTVLTIFNGKFLLFVYSSLITSEKSKNNQ